MLRAHCRYRTLDIVLSELYRYRREMGIDVRVCAMMDRSPPDVQDLLEQYEGAYPDWFFTLQAPRRQLDKDGEHFVEGLNFQIEATEARWGDLEWIYAQDDDRWFSPVQITEELPRALADNSKDAYYCKSLFMWGPAFNTFNTARHHDSILLYRHQAGARWSGRRILNIPDALQEQAVIEGRVGTLRTPLLDYGTFREDERFRVYSAFALAGKTDDYVKSIFAPPALLRFPDDYAPHFGEFKDLWKERWGGV